MSTTAFDQQNLITPDGHTLYVAQYGQVAGPAAVVLHGGPGSGTQPSVLEWFDLSRQRVVLFDQRGAGLSQPQGEIAHNDSNKLVADIELIRSHLNISRWMVVGGSWGATLALLYAGQFTQHVSALVLRGSFLASAREMTWFFQSLQAMVPQAWACMTQDWNEQQQSNVLQTLCQALLHGSSEQANDAARRWALYEEAIMQAMAGQMMSESIVPSATASQSEKPVSVRTLNKYRLQAHYLSHACFTSEADLQSMTAQLADTPAILIHGTHDLVCPPENAMRLKQAMPHAQLRWVAKGGHTPADAGIAAALKQAVMDQCAYL